MDFDKNTNITYEEEKKMVINIIQYGLESLKQLKTFKKGTNDEELVDKSLRVMEKIMSFEEDLPEDGNDIIRYQFIAECVMKLVSTMIVVNDDTYFDQMFHEKMFEIMMGNTEIPINSVTLH